jgi:LytS/YehU family sensor histidine kinase
VITRADFSDPVAIVNPLGTGDRLFSVIREAGKTSKLFTQKGNRCIIGSYERNPLYYLKYPVWFTIYLLVLGFILLIRYLQRRTLRQMVNAEKKIAEMQLLLLRNQLDPHFTFNVINSISASILQSKPEEANRNLLTLSRLMRSGVMHSDNLSRSLAEELEFLHNYLDLMKARTDAGFEYRIEIADTVDLQLHVPRMITQIYAENAIKHGLRPLPSGGILVIRVSCDGKNIRLEIEDNGVGRHKAKANGSHGTGKGMTIMDQSIIIFNKFNQKKIRLDIADLEDGQGLSRGTLVTVVIPVGMKYRFYGE